MAKFQPGQSGNPSGKRGHIGSRLTAVRKMIEPFSTELLEKTLARALEGDQCATTTCLSLYIEAMKETRRVASARPAEAN